MKTFIDMKNHLFVKIVLIGLGLLLIAAIIYMGIELAGLSVKSCASTMSTSFAYATAYRVTCFRPFTVIYMNEDKAKPVYYDVALLDSEIKAEMPYIIFDEDDDAREVHDDKSYLMN